MITFIYFLESKPTVTTCIFEMTFSKFDNVGSYSINSCIFWIFHFRFFIRLCIIIKLPTFDILLIHVVTTAELFDDNIMLMYRPVHNIYIPVVC